MIIAIDGPSASGKSTVAQELSKEINFFCMGTGSMYRALAYVVKHVFKCKPEELSVVEVEKLLLSKRLKYLFQEQFCAEVYFDEKNLAAMLKGVEISQVASRLATNEQVRRVLTNYFRKVCSQKNIIVEGRDVGTVVFPQADIKFFLTAQEKERAARWLKMLAAKGKTMSFEQALQELKARDTRDRTRAASPLVIAHDAIIIDSSFLSVTQTVQAMKGHIEIAS